MYRLRYLIAGVESDIRAWSDESFASNPVSASMLDSLMTVGQILERFL
jgi:hypothetical protein